MKVSRILFIFIVLLYPFFVGKFYKKLVMIRIKNKKKIKFSIKNKVQVDNFIFNKKEKKFF